MKSDIRENRVSVSNPVPCVLFWQHRMSHARLYGLIQFVAMEFNKPSDFEKTMKSMRRFMPMELQQVHVSIEGSWCSSSFVSIGPNPEFKLANCVPRFPTSICKFKSFPRITYAALCNCSRKFAQSCSACWAYAAITRFFGNLGVYIHYVFWEENVSLCTLLVPSMHQTSDLCCNCFLPNTKAYIGLNAIIKFYNVRGLLVSLDDVPLHAGHFCQNLRQLIISV